LNQAKTELKLQNVRVYSARVEALQVDRLFDVITSRAFSELNNFVTWSGHLLAEGGRFYAMKGVHPEQEIARLPKEWENRKITPLQVPNLNVERHLVVIKRVPDSI